MPLPLLLGLAAAVAGAGVVKNQVEKTKESNANIATSESKCASEAKGYKPERVETEIQTKAKNLLLKYAFSDLDKKEKPPIESDWPHLPKHTQVFATRKYSLFSWGEYSFFGKNAVYYHHKKKGIHECLYYDKINTFNITTGEIDYGVEHEKRNISNWAIYEKRFVEQICKIWKNDDKIDCSLLEFCFNNCHDFKMNLSYFKTNDIKNIFRGQCRYQSAPDVLRENFEHITITSMNNGNIELQYWAYFPKVENVTFNENDSDADIYEKERLQEQREQEAEQRELDAQYAHESLVELKDEIAELFQQSLYKLFGTLFDKDKIKFIDDPDFTYEGPSMIDKINNAANTAQSFINDYADKHNFRG